MEEFYKFKREIILRAFKFICFASGLMFVIEINNSSLKGIALGFFVGGVVSIYNFHMQALKASKITGMDTQEAGLFTFKWVLFRYPLMALVLVLAYKNKEVMNFWTTAAGLFACPMAIFWTAIKNLINENKS